MRRRVFITALLLICTSVFLHAHGGMTHVMGTVTGITSTSVRIETTDKTTVEVILTNTTAFLNGSKPSDKTELKIGDRVVIHAVREKDVLQAHEVRFSQGTPASAH